MDDITTEEMLSIADSLNTLDALILALDVNTVEAAYSIVNRLSSLVTFYKIGLELFLAKNSFQFIRYLTEEKDKKVFLDLKMFDIPNTVSRAVEQLQQYKITYASIHGNDAIVEAATKTKNTDTMLLAVSVLTAFDQQDIDDLGLQYDINSIILSRATRAHAIGCDGVVCSGNDVQAIRQRIPDKNFRIVTPGIRINPNINNDQKRVSTIENAIEKGANHLVIGREITQSPDIIRAAFDCQLRIKEAFDKHTSLGTS